MSEEYRSEERRLLKFLVTSAAFFFVGTVHGVLQIMRPIREWLDAIGSPYGGPGHLIDPLAHAHINVVGGVVILLMAATYYFFPRITGKRLFSYKLVEHSYWWTSIGLIGFYSTLMIFGIWQGLYLMEENFDEMERIHSYYARIIGGVATIMGIGFWVYFANVFLTFKKVRKG